MPFAKLTSPMAGMRRLLLFLIVLVGVVLAPRLAPAAYECGGEFDNCPCGRSTPCICCPNANDTCGNCVWHAWHMACCEWQRALEWCTDATTWDAYAQQNNYPTGTEPQNQSIFVCNASNTCSGWGHVGWVVTASPDGSFDSTEQYCGGTCGTHSVHRAAGFATAGFIFNPGVTDVDGAQLVSETIPSGTQFQAGASFSKTWTLLNKGNTTWTREGEYSLIWFSGETFAAPAQSPIPLGLSVAPGTNYTWELPLVAPATGGTYQGIWRMSHTGIGAFGDKLYVKISVDGPQPTVDNARFVSETIPDNSHFASGATFSKSWTMQNSGTSTWVENEFVWSWISGEKFSTFEQTPLAAGVSVAPSTNHAWEIPMVAPKTPGTYKGFWRMEHLGAAKFGQQVWVQIIVDAQTNPNCNTGQDGAKFVSETIPDDTHFSPGQAFTKRWTMKNTGTSTWTQDCNDVWSWVSGEQFSNPFSVSLPAGKEVKPKSTHDWDVSMKAPKKSGTYQGYWQMEHVGVGKFGEKVWVRIIVDKGVDQDNDGYSPPADCNDQDPAINPEALEVCDNGVDDNCDGLTDGTDPQCGGCEDMDMDGFASNQCGGNDCDDNNSNINPNAAEQCDDGLDNDCDGLTDADDADCQTTSSAEEGCGCAHSQKAARPSLMLLLLLMFAIRPRRDRNA